ncbi:hypothetical protein V8G54_035709 [Vigna mungo]|uniref:Retrotransposon gag domain-containing protein n=1 Tax=Vigna mungo TaxID=3915 RepID=A0AAQ3MFK7_VIGMU
MEVGVSDPNPNPVRVKRKTLEAMLEQCQRALELINASDGQNQEQEGEEEEEDSDESQPSTSPDPETDQKASQSRVGGKIRASLMNGLLRIFALCDLIKSRVECRDFLEKLEYAQASVSLSVAGNNSMLMEKAWVLTEEGSSWDLVSENDLWEGEGANSNSEQEDYVLVKQEDIVEGIACFMAAYLLSLKQTKDLTPNQLQDGEFGCFLHNICGLMLGYRTCEGDYAPAIRLFLGWKPINWSDLPNLQSEGRRTHEMEGRVLAVEGQLEAVEIKLAETKAYTVFLRHETGALRQNYEAIRQDIQAIQKLLGDRKQDQHRPCCEGSESSVNENDGGPEGERGRGGGGNREGSANWRKRVELPAFEGLKRALVVRFGEGSRGSVYERLAAIKQVGTVNGYVRDFEVLVGQTTRIPEEQLLGYFMAGLQEEVSDQVRPHDPQDLMSAMRVTRDVEKLRRTIRQEFGFLGGGGGSRIKKQTQGNGGKHEVNKERDDPGQRNSKAKCQRERKKAVQSRPPLSGKRIEGADIGRRRRGKFATTQGKASGFPSYGNPMRKRSHETKLLHSNLRTRLF